MARPRRTTRPRLLTEVELELMTVLWKRGEATVREVLEGLAAGRELAYTSVSTVLRILEQKKLVQSRKEGKVHVYRPAVSKETYEARSVKHLVDKVFDGAPSAMVMRLLDEDELSRGELEELRSRLEEKLG